MKNFVSVRRLLAVAGCAVTGLSAAALHADVVPESAMLRYPDVSKSQIAFVYAGDIWLVGREGGQATLLASPPGQELFPKFSPDGKQIAFLGNYEGNRDIYTISVSGGTATRVTHHPSAEILCDWTADNRLLFYMSGMGGLRRQTQLFTLDPAGGLPAQLPVPYGANGSISRDGTWLAYTPHSTDFRTWKRYRGGMATDIWLFNLKDKSSRKATDFEGTDTIPMWNGDKLYYLSDDGPEHRLNIWVFNPQTGNRKQVTRFKDFDVKWPSMGPGPAGKGEIVFQCGSSLYLLNLDADEAAPKPVKVTIPGDRPQIRSRQVDASEYITGWSISPSGKRVAASARGDIWSLPAEKGSPRNLHRSSAAAQREPSWSPDGRWIAYFCDQSGEYELYITQSDGLGETVQLTKPDNAGGAPSIFRHNPIWSPDSKKIAFTDKSGALYIHTLGEANGEGIPAAGTTRHIDTDPWSGRLNVSWSHDSNWITYSRADAEARQGVIWVCEVREGQAPQPRAITSPMFGDGSPVFDRKGDYLFFVSRRTFSPTYSDLDTTFIYTGTQNILAVPLRADIDSPWMPKSDEEEWKKPDKKGDKKDEKKDDKEAQEGEKKEDADAKDEKDAAKADDITGTWDGTATGPAPLPPGGMPMSLTLKLEADNKVTGTLTCPIYTGAISEGRFDPAKGELTFSLLVEETNVVFTLKLEAGQFTGTADADGNRYQVAVTKAGGGDGGQVAEKDEKKDDAKKKDLVIDFDGIESRAMILPVAAGRFGGLAVNDKNQLLFARMATAGGPEAGIKLFDLADEKKEEKTVASGAAGFELTADGKKMLVIRGRSATIQDASAGATGKNVVTSGMTVTVQPREEWQQIFTDSWRMFRDYFYDPSMHGVDWKAMRERYGKMIADCSSRDDVSFVITEMISELNVGHAYYNGGDIPSGPSVTVGMLGCDFELVPGQGDAPAAYRISRIYQGAPWDADARGPLNQPGCTVKEGDFLLAVNGVPLDTTQSPWAAFQGLANRVVTLTVNDRPTLEPDAAETEKAKDQEKKKDDKEADKPKRKTTGLRHVVVQTLGSEDDLRYRAWIEDNRRHVEEMSGGKVGYVYVPDTGVNGQNNLFRQFYGQTGKQAIIIDERWNGGGQIPTRFIELLNRPVTNYWARRDGKDWKWPPDSHTGPKTMLINGLAGSGGDAFPAYFKQAGLGKLIGMRTWGGLIGIQGYPPLVDGAGVSVPSFAFYRTDGNWGIEGHGVDPDMEVIDDPAKMVDGGDPQLDAAIQHMLEEIEKNGYSPPKKPAYPNRAGWGIAETDR